MTNRGNDRQDIFSLDADWHLFEQDLGDQCERYDVAVLAYAWMTNHFHAVVECQDTDALPEMMRSFQSSYARSYNQRAKRTGSLFEKAYFSRPVLDDDDLLRTARYVHLNPVDIVGQRGLPAYRWSSLGVYLGRREADRWLDPKRLGSMIRPDRYLDELAAPHRWDAIPLGNCPPRRPVTLAEVIAAVDAVCGDTAAFAVNDLVAHLALTLRTASVTRIAADLRVDPTTLRRRARRGRVALATDASFARLCERVLDALARPPDSRLR